MRVTGSRVYSRPPPVPKMPAGLVELMEGLTKDVLKNNPPDVYEFCAEYMRKLLEIRDGPSTKKSLSLERKISKAQEKVRKRAEQRWQKFDELQLQETKIEKNENQTSDQKIPVAIDDNIESIIKPVHHNDLTQASEIEISCEPDSTEKQKLQNDAEPILVVCTVEGKNEKVAEPIVKGNQEVEETKSNDSHIQLIPVLPVFENTDLSQTQDDDCESNIAAPDLNTKDLQNVKENKLIENIEVADVNKNAPIVTSDVVEVDNHAPIVTTDVAEVDKNDPIVTSDVAEVNKNAPVVTSDIAEIDKTHPIVASDVAEVDKNDHIVTSNVAEVDQNYAIVASDVAEVDKNAPIVASDVAEVDKNVPIVASDVAEVDKNNPIVASDVAEVDKNEPIVASDVSEVDKNDPIVASDVAEVDKNDPIVASDVAEVDKNDPIVASVEDFKDDIITVVIEQEKLNESDNLSIPIGNDTDSAFEENDDAIQTDSGISCLDSGKIEEHDLSETNTNVVPETVPKSTIESDGENIVKTDKITDLSLENHIETNDYGKIKSNEKENELHQGNLRKLDETITSLSDIYSANDTEESTTDLEKVMNEAIENTKRKDSSADDSIKDNIALNDERDASESINLVIHRKTIDDPEAEANILFKNDDSKGTKQSHDIDEAMNNHKTEIIESKRPKRSLDNNASDQNDVDIATHTLNDSISAIVADDSAKEADTTIDLNKTPKNDNSHTMDLETAAVTIQKVFRNFLFKSRASTFDDSVTEENNLSDDDEKKDEVFLPTNNLNKERRPLGLSRMESVLQTVNEEKSLSLSTDDSSLSSAATIIQAHVRGFLLRNKLHSLKSASRNSLGVSNGPSSKSLDADADQNKNKTVLNIHIVPEGGNYLSRDESILTSMDLSLDGSPPSSVNLHPFGYNTSERRKQLKREDAVQSVSPPSNNSGKLSEDVDSVKELTINEQDSNANQEQKVSGVSMLKNDSQQDTDIGSLETTPTTSLTVETVVEDQKSSNTDTMNSPEPMTETAENSKKGLIKQSSDEMDVVTPFKENSTIKTVDTNLLHSGEFHDTVLPTKVSRNDAPVASEFKNVMVYFLLWNNS